MSNIAKSDKIYLDYASTTPIDEEILGEMVQYFSPVYSNPSSMYESGRKAKEVVENTRAKVANIINSSPDEIIFIGSGT
ncbi:MAG TPA: aminotransferase class V-fold PLP-dependent enzyme, partial [Candidatus Paceibacterota bacterium]